MNLPLKAAINARDAYGYCTISTGGTQVLVRGDEESIWLCFRGTEIAEIEDLKTDVDFIMRWSGIGWLHRGFWDAYQLVRREIVQRAKFARAEGQTVYVTGHSLGAALASIALVDLRYCHEIEVEHCYAFGCPRIFSGLSAGTVNALYGDLITRFINNNDVVPRVPPESMGYAHAGTPVYFDRWGEVMVDPTEWDRIRDRVLGRLDSLGDGKIEGIKDHSMDAYVANLKA